MTIQPLLDQWTPRLMSVLRIAAGLLFFEHGTSKLLGFPNLPMPDGFNLFPLRGLSGILEFMGGGLLALGFLPGQRHFVISERWRSPLHGSRAEGIFQFLIMRAGCAVLLPVPVLRTARRALEHRRAHPQKESRLKAGNGSAAFGPPCGE
jgi:putative oxidoreductase